MGWYSDLGREFMSPLPDRYLCQPLGAPMEILIDPQATRGKYGVESYTTELVPAGGVSTEVTTRAGLGFEKAGVSLSEMMENPETQIEVTDPLPLLQIPEPTIQQAEDGMAWAGVPLARITDNPEERQKLSVIGIRVPPNSLPVEAQHVTVVASEQTLAVTPPLLPFNPYGTLLHDAALRITPTFLSVKTKTKITTPIKAEERTMTAIAHAVNEAVHRDFNSQFVGLAYNETTTATMTNWLHSLGTGISQRAIPVRVTTNPYTYNDSALAFGNLTTTTANTQSTNNIGTAITYSVGDVAHVYINGVEVRTNEYGRYNLTVDAYLDPGSLYYIETATNQWTKEQAIQQILAKMRTVNIQIKKNSAQRSIPVDSKVSAQEQKARETLREMITESEYRRYLTNGFVMVKGGKSGLWYQIFSKQTGHWLFSYKDGKLFERLCIHTDNLCPPTDHVINMKVLAEIDEEALRKGANITVDYKKDPLYNNVIGDLRTPETQKPKTENLLEFYKRLKSA